MDEGPGTGKRLAGYILYMVGPCSAWLLPWIGVYFWDIKYPPQVAEANNWVAWYFYILPISVATGVIAMLLLHAPKKAACGSCRAASWIRILIEEACNER